MSHTPAVHMTVAEMSSIRFSLGYRNRVQFAEAVGVSEGTVRRWENGTGLISVQHAWLIRRLHRDANKARLENHQTDLQEARALAEPILAKVGDTRLSQPMPVGCHAADFWGLAALVSFGLSVIPAVALHFTSDSTDELVVLSFEAGLAGLVIFGCIALHLAKRNCRRSQWRKRSSSAA